MSPWVEWGQSLDGEEQNVPCRGKRSGQRAVGRRDVGGGQASSASMLWLVDGRGAPHRLGLHTPKHVQGGMAFEQGTALAMLNKCGQPAEVTVGRERRWAPNGHPPTSLPGCQRYRSAASLMLLHTSPQPSQNFKTHRRGTKHRSRLPAACHMPLHTCAAWRPEPTTASSPAWSFISTSAASTGSFLAFLGSLAAGLSPASRLPPAFLPAGRTEGAGAGETLSGLAAGVARQRPLAGTAGAVAALPLHRL